VSKPIRISEYLLNEIEKLAESENRSLTNMVQVLLEQALRIEAVPLPAESAAESAEIMTKAADGAPVREFKPDFKAPATPKKKRR